MTPEEQYRQLYEQLYALFTHLMYKILIKICYIYILLIIKVEN